VSGIFRGGLKSFALLAGAALFLVLLFHDAIAQAFRNDTVFQQSGRLVAQGQQLLRPPMMHFAPDENLERFDIEQLRKTRARSRIENWRRFSSSLRHTVRSSGSTAIRNSLSRNRPTPITVTRAPPIFSGVWPMFTSASKAVWRRT